MCFPAGDKVDQSAAVQLAVQLAAQLCSQHGDTGSRFRIARVQRLEAEIVRCFCFRKRSTVTAEIRLFNFVFVT